MTGKGGPLRVTPYEALEGQYVSLNEQHTDHTKRLKAVEGWKFKCGTWGALAAFLLFGWIVGVTCFCFAVKFNSVEQEQLTRHNTYHRISAHEPIQERVETVGRRALKNTRDVAEVEVWVSGMRDRQRGNDMMDQHFVIQMAEIEARLRRLENEAR